MKKIIEAIKNKRGLTLVETLMAIFIFAICLAGFNLLFIRSWKSNSFVVEMGQSALTINQGLTKMVGYIRKAQQADDGSYAIKSANDNDLVIFSDFNKDGFVERLHFYKSGSQILMGITKPTSTLPKSYPAGDQQIQKLADYIVNENNVPVFYYYNQNYPADTANNPLATPSDVADIRLVKILLKINIDPNKAPDNINMESFVEIRNLNDYDRIR